MRSKVTVDANEAAAFVAYRVSECISIYPITPSSPMGESSDEWSARGVKNIYGTVPLVMEMQSEAGASGTVHGMLQGGALSTTFTASQGLLLMIPNMYKIAGELTPTVFHVTARTVATHALSIFGDHSDVMACRQCGWGLIASNSVQESHDFALIASAASLETRVPFLHFFDGFRTSHEVSKIEQLNEDDMRAMIDDNLVSEHRVRALSPDAPVIRGTAQNPDVFFQAREACNSYYDKAADIVQESMEQFAKITGREYNLFDYVGAEDAENVIVLMGSGAETAHETVDALCAAGVKVGMLKVRLYRPFSMKHFVAALPKTVKRIAVLDRTKEPGAGGEPLYLDVVTACNEMLGEGALKAMPQIIAGRYGLSSKEFTPAMVKSVYDNLAQSKPKNHFTVGIEDDVTMTSLTFDPAYSTENEKVTRALFYGLGSDGTVGANKNSIKIIGEETDNFAQGYFVYDSKKAGSVTCSHLRFGPKPIRSTYLISRANFVACHQFSFLEKFNVLKCADEGATFLLNSPFGADEVWDQLPRILQEQIISKKLKFWVIDAVNVAQNAGMGGRINTVMQTCFFAISGVLPKDEAIAKIKEAIKKTYGKRGDAIVNMNYAAVDSALANLHEVKIPAAVTSTIELAPPVPAYSPEFVKNITAPMIAGEGDDMPVSKMPVDGTYPTGTTKYEKRNIAITIPVWDPDVCIQCGKCVLVCPHAAIRGNVYAPSLLSDAPETFKSTPAKWPNMKDKVFTLQVAPEDCTGCELCVQVCPAKNKSEVGRKAINMELQRPLREAEVKNWDFFLKLPRVDRTQIAHSRVKDVQLLEPLFEFSGACAGCGETPYVKLVTQLFGDRMVIGNATGCSSIYGGNLPTTPYTKNADGRGPAWNNSLFEDTAEFTLGIRLAIDKQNEYALELVQRLSGKLGDELVAAVRNADQNTEAGIAEQRERVAAIKAKLQGDDSPDARVLLDLADKLVRKSVWAIGGDGWAYDIGYGGLDHVLASGKNVNILVLDTEVYSNTGGQMSKATPRAAVAKFAAGGKQAPKKDLAMLAMSYGNVYVGRVAFGANDAHAIKTFLEAEAYSGPSLILAYAHCIAHGFSLQNGLTQQQLAVQAGHWPLIRYNPELLKEGKNPMQLDSKEPSIPFKDYAYNETRYKMLARSNPQAAELLLKEAQEDAQKRWMHYENLANMSFGDEASN
ncbi:pyruvate:ferredoxin (flavodoxin) oxidoreductase [Candidatus Sumerlaeota bacterium]|nr:pyruvate:ferredoxin (flavodoxin) oxidoreductase [Candidatus Sumerlaeota bacterium]